MCPLPYAVNVITCTGHTGFVHNSWVKSLSRCAENYFLIVWLGSMASIGLGLESPPCIYLNYNSHIQTSSPRQRYWCPVDGWTQWYEKPQPCELYIPPRSSESPTKSITGHTTLARNSSMIRYTANQYWAIVDGWTRWLSIGLQKWAVIWHTSSYHSIPIIALSPLSDDLLFLVS